MTDLTALTAEAFDAAADAAFAYLGAHGDHADCGGAWVVVPGNTALGRHLKAAGLVSKHHAGGWSVTVCGALGVQSRIIYEKAADAFCRVLRAAGHEAHVYSYAD